MGYKVFHNGRGNACLLIWSWTILSFSLHELDGVELGPRSISLIVIYKFFLKNDPKYLGHITPNVACHDPQCFSITS